jgi:flagellin
MTSIVTNASAQTALRQLRTVQFVGDEVRSQIATGLKVKAAKDNAAFFLVANTVRSDVVINQGIRENLTLAEGALGAARSAGSELNRIVTQFADLITASQSGIGLRELETAYKELIGQATDIVNAAGFQSVNLLRNADALSVITQLDRTDRGFKTHTLSIDGGDFLRQTFNNAIIANGDTFVLEAELYSANQPASGQTWTEAGGNPGFLVWEQIGPRRSAETEAEMRAMAPRLDYRVLVTEPGEYYVNVRGIALPGSGNSIHVGINGDRLTDDSGVTIQRAGGDVRWGSRRSNGTPMGGERVRINIEREGVVTINIWGREDGTLIDGIVFTKDPTEFAGNTALPPATATGNVSNLSFYADRQNGVARQDAAGLIELLKLLDPRATNLVPESALNVLDGARRKVNRYMAQLGQYERVISRQKSYLGEVSASLSEGVAALVETDLQELSSRLSAIEVQEQLAVESLAIANRRSGNFLTLFR